MSNRITSSQTLSSDRITAEGGRNVSYDLTGRNTEFEKTFELTYYDIANKNGQDFELPYPAWLMQPKSSETLGIRVQQLATTLTSDSADARYEDLEYGKDWNEVELDTTSMAKAYTLWNDSAHEFDGKLTRKINVRLRTNERTVIKITYQAFYQDFVDTVEYRKEHGPEYTKELGAYILDQLDSLESRTKVMMRNMFSDEMHATEMLDEDLTAVSKRNLVQNECHSVNTTEGKILISPTQGSFYPGEPGTASEFQMRYCYQTETHIDATIVNNIRLNLPGSFKGWLFVYTVNNIRLYNETTDVAFESDKTYYKAAVDGSYIEMKIGSRAEYESGSSAVDYYEGLTMAKWSTDHQGRKVYELKSVPYDPRSNFEGGVNDSNALITKECSVILTEENVNRYVNYYGKVIDIPCTDPLHRSRVMVRGEDYEFANVNLAKTERCLTNQPVYDHVRLLKDMVTTENYCVSITYQAFGGNVNPNDVRAIRKDVANAMEILANSNLLTATNIEKQPVVKDLIARLRRIENYHDHFMQVDHQVFKGVSGFHWINIAQISDRVWLDKVLIARELGTFRVHSRDLGWTYEFNVTAEIDRERPDSNALMVQVLGALGPKSLGFNDIKTLGVKENIALRLCWKDDNGRPGCQSGVVLQLGWDYSKYNYDAATTEWDTDTITVTNRSGNTSAWSLYYTPLEVTPYTDASIKLYGHVRYTPYTGRAQSGVPYYKQLNEYVYYKTSCLTVRDGVEFFQKDQATQTFYKITAPAGTKISELGDVYERSLYKPIYQRRAVVEDVIVPEGTYVIDEMQSYDTTTFTMPIDDQTWSEPDPECHSATKLLETDADGVLVWLGNYPLKWYSFAPGSHVRPFYLHLSIPDAVQSMLDVVALKTAVLSFYDRRTERYFKCQIPMACSGEGVDRASRGESIFFFEDLCGIQLAIGPDQHAPVRMSSSQSDVVMADKKYYIWDSRIGQYTEINLTPYTGMRFYDLVQPRSSTQPPLLEPRSYYTIDETLKQSRCVARVEVGVGTSSYINDRFDLRQIRLHF